MCAIDWVTELEGKKADDMLRLFTDKLNMAVQKRVPKSRPKRLKGDSPMG